MFGGQVTDAVRSLGEIDTLDSHSWHMLQDYLETRIYEDCHINICKEDILSIRLAVANWLQQSGIWQQKMTQDWAIQAWPRLVSTDEVDYNMSHFNDMKKSISWTYEELVRTKGFGLDVKILFLLSRFSVTGSGFTKNHTPRRMLPFTPSKATPASVKAPTHRMPLAARLKEAGTNRVCFFAFLSVVALEKDSSKSRLGISRNANGAETSASRAFIQSRRKLPNESQHGSLLCH